MHVASSSPISKEVPTGKQQCEWNGFDRCAPRRAGRIYLEEEARRIERAQGRGMAG